jgi:hypothetical protein
VVNGLFAIDNIFSLVVTTLLACQSGGKNSGMLSLRDGAYALVTAGLDEDIVEHPSFTGLSIALKALW